MILARRKQQITHARQHPLRAAFTLVELLVSAALVVLIMLLFAEIFQLAASSISTQKGIAANDQRMRTLQTILESDISKRTFRDVIPFSQGMSTAERRVASQYFPDRRGYFSISENTTTNNTDDVLQFTINTAITQSNQDDSPIFGKARSLHQFVISSVAANSFTINGDYLSLFASSSPGGLDRIQVADSTDNDGFYQVTGVTASGSNTEVTVVETVSGSTADGTLHLLGNEPEFDDGIAGNNSGASHLAEVSYFLRNGVLYRRVLLIREQYDGGGNPSTPEFPNGRATISQGSRSNYPDNYILNPSTTPSFWNNFDYSTYRIFGEDTNQNGVLDGNEDDGAISPPLSDNEDGNIDGDGVFFHSASSLNNSSGTFSLGNPRNRFGASPMTGVPVEFLPGAGSYIGRFTQQECAHDNFGYPGRIPANAHPYLRNDLTLNTAGVVTQYSGTNRRGEDILMTNVHEFDVKVWAIDFNDEDGDGTSAPGNDGIDDDGDGFTDFLGSGTNFPDFDEVSPTFDTFGFLDLGRGGAGLYTTSANGTFGRRFDTWHPLLTTATPFRPRTNGADNRHGAAGVNDDVGTSYTFTGGPYNGTTIDDVFPDFEPGPDGGPGTEGVDDNDNGVTDWVVAPGGAGTPIPDIGELGLGDDTLDAGELGTMGTDDEIPLRAIQITIRYYDVASDQMRQVTFVHALIDQ